MTWSHFTSYLDGSRPITKAERDELYDNFAALLVSSGCVSSGYSLNSTDQTAIKGSFLLTDLASLDGPGATNTRDRLQAVIAAASSVFTNYSSAVSAALSGEGITSGQRDAILSAAIEEYRLWNYYKRLIDGLTCCTVPTVTSDSASGCVGEAFSFTISATGTILSYGSASLPSGLSLNTSTGEISGTPSAAYSGTFAITATDSCGTGSGSLTLTIASNECSFAGMSGVVSSAEEGEWWNETLGVSGDFPCAMDVDVTWDATDGTTSWVLKANGSTIWYSSISTSGSAAVSVPAGTTSMQLIGTSVGAGSSSTITVECPPP